MGLFDLPAPLFAAVDGLLGAVLPALPRLLLWGVLAGWLTMVAYRRLSNQEKISALKAQQKLEQKKISEFDGEMDELLPLIRTTLGLGFRQLGLAIGPALLATVPVLFLVAWVAGAFGYTQPAAGERIEVSTVPAGSTVGFAPPAAARASDAGWILQWPEDGQRVTLRHGAETLLQLPTPQAVPIIHEKQWWNFLFGNPIGYLAGELPVDEVHIALPAQRHLPFGPGWMQGWMFAFFMTFLLSSVAFKFILKID